MGKTYRKDAYSCFRNPKTKNAKTMEEAARLEIEEGGYKPSNRLQKRSNLGSSEIPTNYDDIDVAGRAEVFDRTNIDNYISDREEENSL